MPYLRKKSITERLKRTPVVYSCCMISGNISECSRKEKNDHRYMNEQDKFYGFQVRVPRGPVRPDAVWVW